MNKLLKCAIIWFYNQRSNIKFYTKVNSILSGLSDNRFPINREKLKEHKVKWSVLSRKVNVKWYKMYSFISKIENPDYIPENIYYNIVEPTLNNKFFSKAYADKGMYGNHFDDQHFIKSILVNREGIWYDQHNENIKINDEQFFNLLKPYSKIVIKPTIDSGGGESVLIIEKKNYIWLVDSNRELTLEFLIGKFKENFLIQEYLIQHPFFKTYNPSSLNTVRIFTYRSVITEEIHTLHSILRVGKKGSMVDNQAAGGVSCRINNIGRLNGFAINKKGERKTNINGIDIENREVPNFSQMLTLVKDVASKVYYSRLLGFDICVDERNNIKIVEINNQNNEINFFQMNGKPLFGEYTEEIINHCVKNKKSFLVDFKY